VPLFDNMTLEEHVATVLMPQRLGLMLLTIFSVSALILAAAGVYAVAAYTVSARTREIGIRMALGAGRSRVLRQVVNDVAAPVAAGVLIGLGIQLATSKLVESFVFGLTAGAPGQLAGASLVVMAAAALALAVPARRAASIDPAIALREP
jgi:putative ABC transport system permease protein